MEYRKLVDAAIPPISEENEYGYNENNEIVTGEISFVGSGNPSPSKYYIVCRIY